jgi:hypothetical protein
VLAWVKLDWPINSLAMKLFHRRDPSPKSQPVEEAGPVPVLPPVVTISLSDEQKTMLETPVDPRVHRLLEKINDTKVAEQARRARRTIGFGQGEEPGPVRAESEKALPDSL